MKSGYWKIMVIVVGMVLFSVCSASAQLESELTDGLKEALKIGTENAVKLVSQEDGFYKNELIKILLPENLRKAEDILKKAGFEAVIDEFELSMNRAAEKAAVSAVSLFGDAITQMTIDDALNILNGKENEATLYFQEKTSAALTTAFQPIIQTAMNDVGVTNAYQSLQKQVTSALPLGVGDMFDIDLSAYVTEKALDGLFTMLAVEEKKIREDPQARVTELLQKVFK
ncbi:hypothetical protein U14_03591 [Candidatus Moduliflexus flocculans]|uniref:DUF4197 domain-containing protein n=1 Tax=Candidatus Moduliflexus flocculans TaxID=1499966 RepID=A0A081BPM4_9BACT|nr:hypothetical protein U14_03591 [Candidatus Moduliflexus flocculans]